MVAAAVQHGVLLLEPSLVLWTQRLILAGRGCSGYCVALCIICGR